MTPAGSRGGLTTAQDLASAIDAAQRLAPRADKVAVSLAFMAGAQWMLDQYAAARDDIGTPKARDQRPAIIAAAGVVLRATPSP